jgi:hypothetical protein
MGVTEAVRAFEGAALAACGRGLGNGTAAARAAQGDAMIAAAMKPRAKRLVISDDAAKTLPVFSNQEADFGLETCLQR